MMLQGSVLPEITASAGNSGAGGTNFSDRNEKISGGYFVEDGERSFVTNRWPREETIALLKVRSDMDVEFRDSNPKAAVWDEVSRRLAELGYNRTAKKCKEKFENVFKYYKRTKDGRSGRQNGKTYRFVDQLDVFDHNSSSLPSLPDKTNQNFTANKDTAVNNLFIKPNSVTQEKFKNPSFEFMSTSTSTTSNSNEGSRGNVKKKRKIEAYFELMMNKVIQNQEILQNKFIEALEKAESDRSAREEAWKIQELARAKREKEILAQERAITAAKDAAVIAFLQKITDQSRPLVQLQENQENPENQENQCDLIEKNDFEKGIGNSSNNGTSSISSRWPRVEVEALIRVRTNLDFSPDNGAKGSLWEEISLAMKKLGYNRSAKRCKEKWENINKYYKRVKESKKRRPEDSKTCPYFHMLESIYELKAKKGDGSSSHLKPEEILLQMMGQQEEHHQRQQEQSMTDNGESENGDDQREEEDGKDGEEVDDDDNEDDNEDDYHVVVNNNNNYNTSSAAATEGN